MGLVKNAFHDEIIAAQDDQRADEFDCYEARLHSLLSSLDWFVDSHPQSLARASAALLCKEIQDMMK